MNLPYRGHVRSQTKFGLDRFTRFYVYWIETNKQTNKQTNTQAKYIYSFQSYIQCIL